METIDYEKQATDFLKRTNTTYKAEFKEFGKHFEDDKESRLIFKITLTRGSRSYSFDFGSSLHDAETFFRQFVRDDWKKHFKYPAKVLEDEYQLKAVLPLLNKHKDKITLPSAYDVLACLTKYDPDTFENFCSEFGYDPDSRKAEKIYKAAKEEFEAVCRLWNDAEIEELSQIK